MTPLRPLLAALLLATLNACALLPEAWQSSQPCPGNAQSPTLCAAQARHLSREHFLRDSGSVAKPDDSQPWQPEASVVLPTTCPAANCLVVGPGAQFSQLQEAISAANTLRTQNGITRLYIKLLPGTHSGPVIIPAVPGAPAITLFGSGPSAADTRLIAAIKAGMPASDYRAQYSSLLTADARTQESFKACADRPGSIGTACATVLWVRADQFTLHNLSIENTTAHTSDAGQAVALVTEGDQTLLDTVRLISRQDTLFLRSPGSGKISRVLMRHSYVEGDVDFVFGRAAAVFEHSTFKAMSNRNPGAYIFAPSHAPNQRLGFLVSHSRLITDGGFKGSAQLGRAWDEGAGKGYLPGSSPNGMLVIRDSQISRDFNEASPWASAATTKRPHAGNTRPERNLDDPQFNRLWQFNNTWH